MDLDHLGDKARVRIPSYTVDELDAAWERLRRAAEDRGLDVDQPIEHLGCAAMLRSKMVAMGCDVTVTDQTPLTIGSYTTDGFQCPHGVTYWIEPTGEQIADWAKRDVK